MVNKPGPLPQPKKGHKFTQKQKQLLKELPTSKTITEAAVKAGYPPKNAAQLGSQALQRMRGRVPDLMEACGLDEKFLIEKHLKRHLTKTRTAFIREEKIEKRVVGRGRNKRTEEVVRHVVKKYTLDDNQIQLRALEQAFLLHGSYAPRDPKEAAQFGVKVIINDLGLLRGANGRPPIDIKPGMSVPELPGKNGSGKNGHGEK